MLENQVFNRGKNHEEKIYLPTLLIIAFFAVATGCKPKEEPKNDTALIALLATQPPTLQHQLHHPEQSPLLPDPELSDQPMPLEPLQVSIIPLV